MGASPPSLSTPAFRAELATAVAEVEDRSSVELIVLVAGRSGAYAEASWLFGMVLLVLVFSGLMFHDAEFGDYTLFLAPFGAFALGFLLPLLMPRLRTLFAARAAIARNVELVARATFQKAGLHATRDATALLVYVSVLERAVFLVADRGVVAALPQAWLDQTRAQYLKAIASGTPGQAILAATRALVPDLERHLPRRPDDMNELPDAIDVVF